MTNSLQALRTYVQFLHETEGLSEIRLSRSAREGLATLTRSRPATTPVTSSATRAPAKASVAGGAATPAALPVNRISTPAKSPVIEAAPLVISGSSKTEQLAHLRERASVCMKCPHLAATRKSVVFGVGDPDARIMFIGEGPGEEEDIQGEPFVGRAGQLLTKMILAMGLKREQVYIANVVKCRPDMPAGAPGNRKPTKQEMDTCLPYLRAQIDVIQPHALVALGATALEGVLGPVGTISKLRGNFHEHRGIPLMPTYHPSYLLRNQSNTEKRKVWEDLMKVMERLEMPLTEKQRGFFLKP